MNPYYQDDHCTIYHGDARVVLPRLPGADAIVTDPPYGIDLEYASYDDTIEAWERKIGAGRAAGAPHMR